MSDVYAKKKSPWCSLHQTHPSDCFKIHNPNAYRQCICNHPSYCHSEETGHCSACECTLLVVP